MERNHRATVQGVVTSVKMNKTIVITVSTAKNDPVYNKRVSYSKKYAAHDENGIAKLGDVVTIMACRPISKTKHFRLVSVDQHAVTAETIEEAEAKLEASEGSAETLGAEEAK